LIPVSTKVQLVNYPKERGNFYEILPATNKNEEM
jgi:hypothetical protein